MAGTTESAAIRDSRRKSMRVPRNDVLQHSKSRRRCKYESFAFSVQPSLVAKRRDLDWLVTFLCLSSRREAEGPALLVTAQSSFLGRTALASDTNRDYAAKNGSIS